jgi:acetolactate synthase-1/2/3 large subunit
MLIDSESTSVSDLLAKTLEDLGIKHVFGIIGAGNVRLFESIAKRGFTEIICVHHEQAACMAVQTYYRACGQLSVALLTTGAGSTNGVTGVVSSWADSIPCLIIAGNESSVHTNTSNPLRMWGVQGYDSCGMVSSVTKKAHRITAAEDVVAGLKGAAKIALSGRPGPVWLEIPMDVQGKMVAASSSVIPNFHPKEAALEKDHLVLQIDQITSALVNAERPVLWLGNGIRLAGGVDEMTELVEKLGFPVLVSWAGIDMLDSDHPLVIGRAGVYGQRAANLTLQNSDYVLAIGTRLSISQVGYDLSELARMARIDVVDIDAAEALKHGDRVTEAVVCDAKYFIKSISDQLSELTILPRPRWLEMCNMFINRFPWVGDEHEDKGGFINSYRFVERLNQFFKSDQVVVTDMGTALLCAHQVLKLKGGQRLMTSTGLGEMGYGLPAAIGASFANVRSEVMCLNCDGGMMLNLQELQTIVHYNLPIKIFIFNNDGYLMIKHTQKALFDSAYVGTDRASGVSCPDYSKVAAAFGIPSYQISVWDEVDFTVAAVQAAAGPVICEVFMHPEQVFSPKLSLVQQADGVLISPPLEDLSPLIARSELDDLMLEGLHEKSKRL